MLFCIKLLNVLEFVVSLQFKLCPKIGEAEGIPPTSSNGQGDDIPIEAKEISTAGKSGILKVFPKTTQSVQCFELVRTRSDSVFNENPCTKCNVSNWF